MRCYTKQPHAYCGIALHARSLDVCLRHQDGEIVLHRPMKARPETFLRPIAPSRAALVLAVAWVFPWYGLADLCAPAGLPFVLGHALSLQALHGGQAKNDPIDAHKSAVLLRGGLRPQASVAPAARRATRDLRRRRMPRMRQRAALLAPIHNTTSQDNLPERGTKLASQAHRAGVAERFPAPAGPQSLAGDLALLGSSAQRLSDVALPSVNAAKPHDAQPLYGLQPVPGIGPSLRLVLLDAMHAIQRIPRVQDVLSSWRVVQGVKEAAGTRSGTSGPKIGQAHLTWACSAAAVLC